MKLTPVDRERLTDSMLKIESVRSTLSEVEPEKIPQSEEINECLTSAHNSLREALGYKRRS